MALRLFFRETVERGGNCLADNVINTLKFELSLACTNSFFPCTMKTMKRGCSPYSCFLHPPFYTPSVHPLLFMSQIPVFINVQQKLFLAKQYTFLFFPVFQRRICTTKDFEREIL